MRHFPSKCLYNARIKPAANETPMSTFVADNLDFLPWFEGCIGAIDGTHISISPEEGYEDSL